MDRIFGCHRNWNFCCFTAEPRKVKVVKEKDKTYSFEFPWDLNQTMHVDLTSYDKKKQKLTGTFKVIEGGLFGKIDFEVRHKKRELAGTPSKFHHGTWTLYRGKRSHL